MTLCQKTVFCFIAATVLSAPLLTLAQPINIIPQKVANEPPPIPAPPTAPIDPEIERKRCVSNTESTWIKLDDDTFECINQYKLKEIEKCRNQKGKYGTFGGVSKGGSRRSYCRMPDEIERKKSCLNKPDHTWEPQGMWGIHGCIRYYSDAGKSCQSGDDCLSNNCQAQPMTLANPEQDMSHGICARNNSHFGCHSKFDKGKITNSICID